MKNIEPSVVEHSLSHSITMGLTLLNKYRMKSNVDNFGKGLLPWHLEPATIFVLTNGLSAIRDSEQPILTPDSGGELYNYCLRWDHKIVSYIVNTSGKPPESYYNTSLSRLSILSAGEMWIASGLKQAISDLAARYAMQTSPNVTVDVSLLTVGTIPNSYISKAYQNLVGTLSFSHPGDWPLPEAQWIDRSVDSLSRRPMRPQLQIIIKDSENSGPGYSSDQLHSMITAARNNGLQPDIYTLSIVSTNSKKRSLRLFSKSGQTKEEDLFAIDALNESPLSSDRLPDGCLGYRCCGVRLLVDVKENSNPCLFAILCPTIDGKRSDLLVFPYNFPQLLPLLQQAKDICTRIGGSANLMPNSLPQPWQLQMGAYLRTVPPYYYPALFKTFKSLGLHLFFSLLIGSATSSPPPLDISLSRPCLRQLTQVAQKAKADLCLIDPTEALGDSTIPLASPIQPTISLIDGKIIDDSLLEYNTTNHRGPISIQRSLHWKNPTSLLAVGITSSAHRAHNGPISLYQPAIPHISGSPPAAQDLLYTWEKIRSAIYGGTGMTVRGLYVAGLHGSSSGSYMDKDSQHTPDWFFKACGGATVPRLSITCMSDYVSILSKKEVLRDPELLNPPVDEDQAQGILKRKLAVNFGSPYKSSRKSGNKKAINDEPALPAAYEYRDGVTVTDDIFNLPSPDQNIETNSNEAGIAFFAPPSPLVTSEDRTEPTGTRILPNTTYPELKVIPKLKLKGKKAQKVSLPIPKPTKVADDNDNAHSAVEVTNPLQPASSSKNVSGIAFTAPWMTSNSSSPSSSPGTPTMTTPSSTLSSSQVATGLSTPSSPAGPTASSPVPPVVSSPPTEIKSLPAGWIKRFSEKHKCDYWFNTVTGVSQWIPPTHETTPI